jgi:hypothetical protein
MNLGGKHFGLLAIDNEFPGFLKHLNYVEVIWKLSVVREK